MIFDSSEVHSLPIPFSKESMRVKKVANLNLLDTLIHVMCHADTCVPHEIRDEWILQVSLQLVDTVGASKFVH